MILDQVPGRDDVRHLMSRSEFQYPKSLLERIGEWLGDQLDRFFNWLGGPRPTSFGGGVGPLVGWLIILLALAAVVAVVVIVVRRWVPRMGADEEDALSDTEVEHRRRASEWASEADRLEAAGEWKLALRARYRELVRTLVDRRQVADLAGRTTGELREDMAETTPVAVDAFDTACLLFELPWYGHVPTAEAENLRFKEAAVAVLAAPVEQAVGNAPVAAAGSVVLVDADSAAGGDGAAGGAS